MRFLVGPDASMPLRSGMLMFNARATVSAKLSSLPLEDPVIGQQPSNRFLP